MENVVIIVVPDEVIESSDGDFQTMMQSLVRPGLKVKVSTPGYLCDAWVDFYDKRGTHIGQGFFWSDSSQPLVLKVSDAELVRCPVS